MPEITEGTPACPDADDRSRRLAVLLADMMPGAAIIRINLRKPRTCWPHLHVRVYDASGRRITVPRAKAVAAARWILRAHPQASWDETHDFDVTEGVLRTAAASGTGRGC
jgi:hypothetical protein